MLPTSESANSRTWAPVELRSHSCLQPAQLSDDDVGVCDAPAGLPRLHVQCCAHRTHEKLHSLAFAHTCAAGQGWCLNIVQPCSICVTPDNDMHPGGDYGPAERCRLKWRAACSACAHRAPSARLVGVWEDPPVQLGVAHKVAVELLPRGQVDVDHARVSRGELGHLARAQRGVWASSTALPFTAAAYGCRTTCVSVCTPTQQARRVKSDRSPQAAMSSCCSGSPNICNPRMLHTTTGLNRKTNLLQCSSALDHSVHTASGAVHEERVITSPAAERMRGDGREHELMSCMKMVSTSVYSTCAQGRPGASELRECLSCASRHCTLPPPHRRASAVPSPPCGDLCRHWLGRHAPMGSKGSSVAATPNRANQQSSRAPC